MMTNRMMLFLALCSALVVGACSDDSSDINTSLESTSILDRTWDLTRYTGIDGNEYELLEFTSRQFKAESEKNNLRGRVDCNGSNGGTYQLSEDVIVFTFGLATEVSCERDNELGIDKYIAEEDSLNDLLTGQGETRRLSRELMISLQGRTLTLTVSDGRKLYFTEID